MAVVHGSKVLVESKRVESRLQQKGFGERTEREYVLGLKEAIYLLEKKKIEVKDAKGKRASKKKLLELGAKKEKNFYNKMVVYRDLRDRGFCAKTGFKFGFDFRVYPRGKKPGQAHTEFVVHVAEQNERKSMTELSRMVRLSGNIRTKMVIAVVDSENDINYYRVERVTP